MGKAQKKTGKGRLDKYYKLAKEQGYRARSAFKLIQLNKKYSFLESARCCIDLCAAPGGWLQVASKYMPVNSVIVGVDLVPIKPIPHVVTFATDITTPLCRQQLRGELKDWKADVVLHDGAPNVGTAWIQDAYSQSELVLMSLKLAVEFLAKGGTFVTKVFRSADYNNLMWVFNQLFGKVEATKPPSSRNVSAEIFVVCREFHAPKFIDPKFLDPKHVFKDLAASLPSDKEVAHNAQINVFQPEKKRRHRDGYADGDYTLFKACAVEKFVKEPDPIAVLGTYNKIAFDTDEEKGWLQLDVTTPEIKANLDDLKVLGKGDFKAILKWRLALREELGLDNKISNTEDATETVEITEEVDEETQIQNELERLNSEAAARTKRERRKANEVRTKTITRMQLSMTAPLDIGLEFQDASLGIGQEDVFDLAAAERQLPEGKTGKQVDFSNVDDEPEDSEADGEGDEENFDDDDEDEARERRLQGLEAELDGLYDMYQTRMQERDAKFKVKEAQRAKNTEWGGIGAGGDDEDADEDGSDAESEDGGWDVMQRRKRDDGDSSEDESDDDEPVQPSKKRQGSALPNGREKRTRLVTSLKGPAPPASQASKVWFSQDVFKGLGDELDNVEDDAVEMEDAAEDADVDMETPDAEDSESDNDDFEIVPQDEEDDTMWDVEDDDMDEAKRAQIQALGLNTAEAVTLAQQLVNRETSKTALINDGFSRYSLNSKDGLPSWFLDEESKHYKPNLPVTKEAVAALRAKQRALDARPIKKIAEAKARKKFKAVQRLEKAMKKAEGVNSTTDISEREKAQQIEKLMRKGASSGHKKAQPALVVAKGAHKGVKGRPKGVKGRYTMVDSRMKKELRAKKRKAKAEKKR
ncbi:FtsJ-domain-containing protein [Cylindrobasidium torrendii FP15055 ss-10]|uniref:FtsJ-domain-containing protein n=1 Tax=Cylindrobasidium torrendii FP15055 ss-10 TaxID=1314674 RepID=A0A0D7BR13_9AGAR|nr:FtsJ-domain-containing protein [Cylindrobasidium torrendii FP15055 ss-10]